MHRRHVVIPLLAAALALQGAVAVAPHQHRPAGTDGVELFATGSPGGHHHCLACAVHAPVVEAASGTQLVAVESCDTVVSGARFVPAVAGPVGPAGPRGPPLV